MRQGTDFLGRRRGMSAGKRRSKKKKKKEKRTKHQDARKSAPLHRHPATTASVNS